MKRARISNPTATSSSSSSSSEEEDESGSEDTAQPQTTSTSRDSSSKGPSTHTSAAPRTYHPPEGFSQIKRSSTTSHLQTLFNPTNLAGKQIWHITLPADIPITTLKEVDIEKAKSGARILSHHGVEFGFVMEAQNAATKDGAQLLVASDGGATYSTIPDAFDATLRLQQSKHPAVSYSIPGHAQAGSSDTGVEGAARPTVPRAKEVRQQPPGLRTRFWPNGFEDRGLGDSEGGAAGKSRSTAKTGKESATTSESSSSSGSSEDESEEEL